MAQVAHTQAISKETFKYALDLDFLWNKKIEKMHLVILSHFFLQNSATRSVKPHVIDMITKILMITSIINCVNF